MSRVLVSGAAGRIGRAVIAELRAHGCDATAADLQAAPNADTQIVDFEDFGQVIAAMHGHDAVIHLAAIPSPLHHPAHRVFRTNSLSTFNVLEAAAILNIDKVVMASSITALGYGFRHRHFNPQYLPIDEAHPLLAQDSYGLSKMVGESLAAGFSRRCPSMSLVSLRFTAVFDERAQEWVQRARAQPPSDTATHGAFWTYVDVRDAAAACRLALETRVPGHEAFFICAPQIYRADDIRELMARWFAGDYPIAEHLSGTASPVDCSKAERLLGWRARYSWDGSEL